MVTCPPPSPRAQAGRGRGRRRPLPRLPGRGHGSVVEALEVALAEARGRGTGPRNRVALRCGAARLLWASPGRAERPAQLSVGAASEARDRTRRPGTVSGARAVPSPLSRPGPAIGFLGFAGTGYSLLRDEPAMTPNPPETPRRPWSSASPTRWKEAWWARSSGASSGGACAWCEPSFASGQEDRRHPLRRSTPANLSTTA